MVMVYMTFRGHVNEWVRINQQIGGTDSCNVNKKRHTRGHLIASNSFCWFDV